MVPTRKPNLEIPQTSEHTQDNKDSNDNKNPEKENSGNPFDFRYSDNREHNIKSQLNQWSYQQTSITEPGIFVHID